MGADPDPRVTCTTCRHYWRTSRCLNHRAALLSTDVIGPDLAALPQHCLGFARLARPPPPAVTLHHQTDHQTDRDRAQTENPPTEPRHPPESNFEDITMIVTDSGAAAFTPCPPGSYRAHCCRIIDLGTVTSDFQGEAKTARKVLLTWEILDDEARRDDGEPFLLSKRYTSSLHEKAALRRDLASWRGRDFTADELRGFDLRNVLGRDCFISVVQATKPDGRTFSNIAALMRMPKGAALGLPQPVEPLLMWDMAAPDWEVFAKLPPKLAQQVEASPEFKALRKPAAIALNPPPATEPSAHAFADMADDMPEF